MAGLYAYIPNFPHEARTAGQRQQRRHDVSLMPEKAPHKQEEFFPRVPHAIMPIMSRFARDTRLSL